MRLPVLAAAVAAGVVGNHIRKQRELRTQPPSPRESRYFGGGHRERQPVAVITTGNSTRTMATVSSGQDGKKTILEIR